MTDKILQYREDLRLSEISYKDGKYSDLQVGNTIGNYEIVADSKTLNFTSGYQGLAFRHLETNEIKISHRGSDELIKDFILADGQILFNKLPDAQINDAAKFIEDVSNLENIKESQINHVGHSLGGFVAKIFALRDGSNAVTVNAPKIGNYITELGDKYGIDHEAGASYDRIKHVYVEGDPVSSHGGPSMGEEIGVRAETSLVHQGIQSFIDIRGSIPLPAAANVIIYVAGKAYNLKEFHSISKLNELLDGKYSQIEKIEIEDASGNKDIVTINRNEDGSESSISVNGDEYQSHEGDAISVLEQEYGEGFISGDSGDNILVGEGGYSFIRSGTQATLPDGSQVAVTDLVEMHMLREQRLGDKIKDVVSSLKSNLFDPATVADMVGRLARGEDIEDIATLIVARKLVSGALDQTYESYLSDEITEQLTTFRNSTELAAQLQSEGLQSGTAAYDARVDEILQSKNDELLNKAISDSPTLTGIKTALVQFGVTMVMNYDAGMDSSEYAKAAANASVAGAAAAGANLLGMGAASSAGAAAAVAHVGSTLIATDGKMNSGEYGDMTKEAAIIGALTYVGWIVGGPVGAIVAGIVAAPAITYYDNQYKVAEDAVKAVADFHIEMWKDPSKMLELDRVEDLANELGHLVEDFGENVVSFVRDIGRSFKSFFGGSKAPPPPPLTHTVMKADGSVSIYSTGAGTAGVLAAREGMADDLIGTDQHDLIVGSNQANTLIGKGDNDIIYGGAGDDTISGGSGDDAIAGESGSDTIDGGDGDDVIFGDEQDNQLSPGHLSTATLSTASIAETYDDKILGGAGNDKIYGGSGADIIDGGSENDLIVGGEGDDIISGGTGDDTIEGNTGNDQLSGGEGNDTINGNEGDDRILGEAGNDNIFGDSGDDLISGGEGNDTIDGGIGNDQLSGDAGDDSISGNDGDDILMGDLGNDSLSGGLGNDSVFGGIGNDTISGDAGDDHLHGEIGIDTISGGDGNDTITGGSGDDLLSGNAGNDDISGGDGADQIDGGIGNDTLKGDAGNDVIFGRDGNDIIYGNDDNDTLSGEAGNDTIYGGSGDDIITGGSGDDALQGNSGNDKLDAGTGNNTSSGGSGDDKYVYQSSYGNLEITEESGNDSLEFSDLRAKDIDFAKTGDDLVLTVRSTGNKITVKNHFLNTNSKLDNLKFSDGYNIQLSNLILGTDLDDTLTGTEGDDTVLSLDGNDTIIGQGGDDYLNGGDGNDIIYGGTGNDRLDGSYKDDYLDGGDGNDHLVDGLGSDRLFGGAGNDNFVISQNSGDVDVITDFNQLEDSLDLTSFGNKFINLEQLQKFYNVSESSGNTVLNLAGGQKITLENLSNANFANSNISFDIESISGNTGSDKNEIITGTDGNDVITDGKGLDILTGGNGADLFQITKNTANNDIDTITDFSTSSGDKIDIRSFGNYIDVRQLNLEQNGSDTIIHFGKNQDSTTQKLVLKNINKSDLTNDHFKFKQFDGIGEYTRYQGAVTYDFSKDNKVEGNQDVGTVTYLNADQSGYQEGTSTYETDNFFTSANIFTEGADNTLFNQEYWVSTGGKNSNTYLQRDGAFYGNDSVAYTQGKIQMAYDNSQNDNDIMNGAWWSESIFGYGGHDKIFGNNGYDSIWAGVGNDWVDGGNDGDTIYGENGKDALHGGTGNDYIDGGAGNDTIYGNTGNDTLRGNTGDDYLIGGDGSDTMHGDDGHDLMTGDAGSDYLSGGNGDDRMDGGADNDQLYGGSGNDDLLGDTGNDHLQGNQGNDQLQGGDGDDVLYGNSGDDELLGNAGNDILYGNDEGTFGGEFDIKFTAGFAPSSGGWVSQDKYPREFADINGDGFADLIGFASGGVYTALGKGDGTFHSAKLGIAAFTSGTGGWNSNDVYPRKLADINGDGMADIVGFASGGVFTSLAKGDGTFHSAKLAITAYTSGTGGWNSHNTYPRELADINGDGLADIVGFASGGVFTSLAKGDGTFHSAKLGIAAFTQNTGGWNSNNTYPRDLADVNGDGLADIVGFGSGMTYVSLSKGDGTFESARLGIEAFVVGHGWASNDTYPRRLADVNGDNIADIIGFGYAGVYTALGKGDGTFNAATYTVGAFNGANGWSNNNTYPRDLADLNGDNKADIIGIGSGGIYTAIDTSFIANNNRLDGGDGDDRLFGTEGNDHLIGGTGEDYMEGSDSHDKLEGGTGNDWAHGGNGVDEIKGEDGHDILYGGSGQDNIQGGAGSDIIDGGNDGDTISGGDGNDLITANQGDDTVNGDAGNDMILGSDGNDTLSGGADEDHIESGTGDDTVNGNSGNDIILGGSGNDTLAGNDGADKITGGTGNDSITGGLGMDLLHGGDGVDTFNFDSLEDSSVGASDIIEDFEDGIDQIKISQVIADSIGGLTISNDGTNTYIDDIDSDFQVSLNGVINLDNTDFIFGA